MPLATKGQFANTITVRFSFFDALTEKSAIKLVTAIIIYVQSVAILTMIISRQRCVYDVSSPHLRGKCHLNG